MVKDPAITGGESARVPSWVRFGLVPFEPDHKTDPYLFTIGIQWTIDAWTGALMLFGYGQHASAIVRSLTGL